MKNLAIFLIGVWFGYVIHPDEAPLYRTAMSYCDSDPLRYSGFVAFDGDSYHCFQRASQYPNRIKHFVITEGTLLENN
jgi:hypothetical protein